MGSQRVLTLIAFLLTLATDAGVQRAQASCPFCYPQGGAPLTPGSGNNVNWTYVDSIAACPAGDSLTSSAHPHAARLRMEVWYNDNNCNPKPKVPPDSIWVTVSTLSGNVIANDLAAKLFADDSTDALCGHTWITIPSFSGCGTLQVSLYVSGVAQGNRNVVVRSVDTNADGRISYQDVQAGPCDVDYDGHANGLGDISQVRMHTDHWRRNALHGTPVRITNFCSDPVACPPGSPNTTGSGTMDWEPNGNRIAFSARTSASGTPCAIFLVSSVPNGTAPTQFTIPPGNGVDDYDPRWSPVLGKEICFDRGDSAIIRKGVGPGSSEILVTSSGIKGAGDDEPAFSPDGKTIAFVRTLNPPFGPNSIFTVPTTGGTATRITTDSNVTDQFPEWSPDGTRIIFERYLPSNHFAIYSVLAQQGATPTAIFDPATGNATLPSFAPDSQIVISAVGSGNLAVNTINPVLAPSPPAIPNYAGFAHIVLAPKPSPDGTRLALAAPPPGTSENAQLWAVRRNMNNPPVLAEIGGSNEQFQVEVGDPLTFTISATDTESDPLVYQARYLQLGMAFDRTTRTFTWTPPAGTANNTYNVQFQVTQADSTGGTDWQVVRLKVVPPAPSPNRPQSAIAGVANFANPSRGPFLVLLSNFTAGTEAEFKVMDASGRLVFRHQQESSQPFVWDATSSSGMVVPPGVYFYQVKAGTRTTKGKWVVIR